MSDSLHGINPDSPNADTDPLVWAVRALGLSFSIVGSADTLSKDEIVDYLRQLAELAPTPLLMATAGAAAAIAGQNNPFS